MPYAYDPNEDPNSQQNQPGQAPQLAGGGQVIGGSAATSGSGATTGGSSGTPTHSGNFQNLNAYLDANSGNGFGGQFGQKLASDTAGASQVQSQAQQNFQQKSDAGSLQPNSSLVSKAMSDPTGFVSDPSNVSSFQNQLNAQYKGPSTFSDDQSDYQQAAGATQHAQDVAGNAQTEQGRFSLLNNYFGNSNYSQGQQGLDNLLVSNDKQAQQGIQQAAANANQAGQGFQNLQNTANSYAAQNAGNTAQANIQAHNALGIDASGNVVTSATAGSPYGVGAIGNLQNSINSQVTAGQTAQQANYDRILSELQSGNISSADATMIGLNPQAYNQQMFSSIAKPGTTSALSLSNPAGFGQTASNQIHTFGLSGPQIAQMLSRGNSATAGNVASAGDYAKMQALSQLANIDNTFLPGVNASQAGTFSANPQFNNAGLQQQINTAAQSQFNNVLNTKQENEAQIGTENHNLGSAYNDYYKDPSVQAGAANNPALQATLAQILKDYQAAQGGQGWDFGNSINVTG